MYQADVRTHHGQSLKISFVLAIYKYLFNEETRGFNVKNTIQAGCDLRILISYRQLPGFDARTVRTGFVVKKLTLRQGFLLVQ